MNKSHYFTARSGEKKIGYLIKMYEAFEGGMRYILRCEGEGINYRCVKDENGNFKEYVA